MIQSSAIYYKIKGESNEKNRNKKFSKCIQGIKYRAIRVARYKKWLGEPDVISMNGVAEYQLSPNSWLQLSCEEKYSIETSSIVVGVEDINQTKKTLDECGIKTSEIIDYEVVLVLDVFDIDGNKITFAKEV